MDEHTDDKDDRFNHAAEKDGEDEHVVAKEHAPDRKTKPSMTMTHNSMAFFYVRYRLSRFEGGLDLSVILPLKVKRIIAWRPPLSVGEFNLKIATYYQYGPVGGKLLFKP